MDRVHCQHCRPDEPLLGYRNGYEAGHLCTAAGDMAVQVPQVRDWIGSDSDGSELTGFSRRNRHVPRRLAEEIYARGPSARDTKDALQDATGKPLQRTWRLKRCARTMKHTAAASPS